MTIRAWAVVIATVTDPLVAWGNDKEFSYPVFSHRKYAVDWLKHNGKGYGFNLRIVRCKIRLEAK